MNTATMAIGRNHLTGTHLLKRKVYPRKTLPRNRCKHVTKRGVSLAAATWIKIVSSKLTCSTPHFVNWHSESCPALSWFRSELRCRVRQQWRKEWGIDLPS